MNRAERLQAKVRVLPGENEQMLLPIWRKNIKAIRHCILTRNPKNFLRWREFQRSMVVGLPSWLRHEIHYVESLPDWNDRWRTAIEEAKLGNPRLLKNYPFTSGYLFCQAYTLAKFEEEIKTRINDIRFIFDFGGGYGSMCRLIKRLGFKGDYVIYDLPVMSALQEFYLGSLNLSSQVTFLTELERRPQIIARPSLFLATWSFSETPLSLRTKFLEYLGHFDLFLFGFKNELEGVNNLQFFENLTKSLPEIDWQLRQKKHLPSGAYYYLTGIRKVAV